MRSKWLRLPLAVLAALVATCGTSWGSWVNRNPGAGGAFTQVAVGADSNYVFVSSDVGGMAMTRDGGATWHEVGSADSLNDQNCYSVAADPTDTNYVYLGCEDSLYVSTDCGNTFDGKFYAMITAIGIMPSNGNIIYAAGYSGGSQAFQNTNTQFYASFDHGVTWQPRGNLINTRIQKILVDPRDPNNLYVLSWPDFSGQAFANKSIYRSTDGGKHWLNISPTDIATNVSDIAINLTHPDELFCIMWSSDNSASQVYRSRDGGSSFSPLISNSQVRKFRGTVTCATPVAPVLFGTTLAANPKMSDGSDLTYFQDATGTVSNVFDVSTDGSVAKVDSLTAGSLDTTVTIDYIKVSVRVRAVNPLTGNFSETPSQPLTVYIGDMDGGQSAPLPFDLTSNTWTNITSEPIYTDPDGHPWTWARVLRTRVWATMRFVNDNVPFSASTYALRISEFSMPIYASPMVVYVQDPSNTGEGGASDSMFYSINSGNTWSHFPTTGWEHWWKSSVASGYSFTTYAPAKTFATDPSNTHKLWQIGNQFISKTNNGGLTFTNQFADVVGNTYAGRGINNVEPASSAAAGSNIYEGFWDIGFWRSTDGGVHWSNMNDGTGWDQGTPPVPGSNGGNVLNILVDQGSTSKVWMTNGNNSDSTRMYWSNDAGTTLNASTGVPAKKFLLGLAMDSLSTVGSRKIYLSQNGSLLRSTDDGHSFVPISSPSTVRTIAAKGDTVIIGGEGGLYRCANITAATPVWTYLGFAPVNSSGTPLPGAVDRRSNWNGQHDIKIIGSKMVFANYACAPAGCALYGGFWEAPLAVSSGVTNFALLLPTNYARSVAVAPNGDVYLGASDGAKGAGTKDHRAGGIVRSTDGMQSWVDISSGIPWPSMGWAMCVDPAASAWVLVANPGTGFWKGP